MPTNEAMCANSLAWTLPTDYHNVNKETSTVKSSIQDWRLFYQDRENPWERDTGELRKTSGLFCK